MHDNVIVLDTNIWVSYILAKKLDRLVNAIVKKNLTVLTCRELVDELNDVLRRRKFKKCIAEEEVAETVIIHKKITSYYSITENPFYFRDKKDDFLLSLCKKGNAGFLVSGDRDVLESGIKPPPEIISKSDFEKLFL